LRVRDGVGVRVRFRARVKVRQGLRVSESEIRKCPNRKKRISRTVENK
jgi:hypothetical protein